MTTLANALALFGMALIRFGGRSGSGIAFMLFGLLIVGVVVWALARPYEPPKHNARLAPAHLRRARRNEVTLR